MAPVPHAPRRSVLGVDVVKARLHGQRALVLEEDVETFGRIFMSLSSVGCSSVLARRASQAFQFAERTRPTLIIVSTSLEGVRAPDLIGELRANPATAGAVLVALTREDSKRERRRLTEVGCDGYLCKPVDRYLFAAELLKRTPRLMGEASANLPAFAEASRLPHVV